MTPGAMATPSATSRAGTVTRSKRSSTHVEAEPTVDPLATPSRLDRGVFTAWHEIVPHAGDQHTIYPDTLHWFQAGPEGAIVTEFSTRSTDEFDVFTDPDIRRVTVVTDS